VGPQSFNEANVGLLRRTLKDFHAQLNGSLIRQILKRRAVSYYDDVFHVEFEEVFCRFAAYSGGPSSNKARLHRAIL
jgi:hypothetical protein